MAFPAIFVSCTARYESPLTEGRLLIHIACAGFYDYHLVTLAHYLSVSMY